MFSVKSMTVLLAIAAANVGYANTVVNNGPNYKESALYATSNGGFYVGAQAGYDSFRVGQTVSSPAGTFSTTASLTGWLGGLFIGYGQYFNSSYYLGAELFGNYNGANQVFARGADDDGDSFTRKHKADGTLGLALIPGIKLNEATLGYLRLGYDWTYFQNSIVAANGGGPSISSSHSATLGGFDFGLGLETLVCDHWSVRTQYDHIWYNNKSTTPFPGLTSTTKPSDNQFTLGVLYRL